MAPSLQALCPDQVANRSDADPTPSRYPLAACGKDDYPLAHNATAAADARRHTRQVLAGWGIEEDVVFDALLVVSELVTNAVEHALPPIDLHLQVTTANDGCAEVGIDVLDGGPAAHDGPWTTNCAADEHGRGHQVVAALADDITAGNYGQRVAHGAILRRPNTAPDLVRAAA